MARIDEGRNVQPPHTITGMGDNYKISTFITCLRYMHAEEKKRDWAERTEASGKLVDNREENRATKEEER